MRRVFPLAIVATLLLSTTLFAGETDSDKEMAAVKDVIENAYIRGVHTEWDAGAARSGFHPEFVMLILENGGVRKLSIADWTKSIEQKKQEHPEGPQYEITYEIPLVDITGNAAVARIELYRDGAHLFTDYMSLYKFADGWKIVGKIFQRHM